MSNVSEPEFEQALNEVKSTLAPLFKESPEYEKALEIIQIPERIIQFRVTYERDDGSCEVVTGWRVQFNSTLGPYKGGLRLHPSVNLSILKFLGFEQIFKNALTGLPMGGGKGGSNFNPKDKSDAEIRRFCFSFMRELSRHIGDNTDVPAGDIGTGAREVAFMFGAYKQIRNEWAGILTGKGLDWGGSRVRPEATGYGLVYFVNHMIASAGISSGYNGMKVVVSGSGQVAQFAALKVIELGGTILSFSDSKGAILATGDKGLTPDYINQVYELKLKHGYLQDLPAPDGFEYKAGVRPWTYFDKVDVALPCATQNEVSGEEAKKLVSAGCKFVAEGSNMGCTKEAIDVFEAERAAGKTCWYGPGKAANSGGVAVSGLEMAQNSSRIQWSAEDVDSKLQSIMENCFGICYETGKKYSDGGKTPSLVVGANIAGFLKVANASKQLGDWW